MSITIKSNVPGFVSGLDKLAKKQAPFAASRALNNTAWKVKAAEEKGVSTHIDRATPFTKKSVRVKKSTKKYLTAAVFFMPVASKYLKPIVEGEKEVYKKGGGKLIPATEKMQNQFGNAPRKTVIKSLLSDKKRYFSGTPTGRKTKGIYRRLGTSHDKKLQLLFTWSNEMDHREVYPFYDIADKEVKRVFERELKKAMDYAIKTAKR